MKIESLLYELTPFKRKLPPVDTICLFIDKNGERYIGKFIGYDRLFDWDAIKYTNKKGHIFYDMNNVKSTNLHGGEAQFKSGFIVYWTTL